MQQNPTLVLASRARSALKASAWFLAIPALLVGLIGLSASPASAADVQGRSAMMLGYGAAGKALKNGGVTVSSVAPATQTRYSGKRVRIEFPVASIDEGRFKMSGAIRFKRGKRALVVRNLALNSSPGASTVTGSVGKRRLRVFTIRSRPTIDSRGVTMSLRFNNINLLPGSARLIKSRLALKRVPAGTIGGLGAFAALAFEDPFLDLCGLGAATRTFGEVPLAAPAPELVGPSVTSVNNAITWGIKASLNGYVNGFNRPLGLDGATVNAFPGPPAPGVPPKDYTFVAAPGQYAANDAGTGFDDQAVVNSTGGVMYCNTAHGFRITISNPTVVINGSASRIIADVDTNLSGNPASGVGDWMPTQRVNLARLDLSGVPAVEIDPDVFRWSAIPATLTQEGSDALRLCEVNVPGAPPNCLYPPGKELDPITVTVADDTV